MRLCVNQQGERMDAEACGDAVQEINKLTVVASESYTDFVGGLQTDIKDNLYARPTKATVEYFTNQIVKVENKTYKIDQSKAYAIFTYLRTKIIMRFTEVISTK